MGQSGPKERTPGLVLLSYADGYYHSFRGTHSRDCEFETAKGRIEKDWYGSETQDTTQKTGLATTD